jgi:hypothetical protein
VDEPLPRESLFERLKKRGASEAEKLSEDLELRVGREQLARWRARAEKEGVPLSVLVRRVTDEALALYDSVERHGLGRGGPEVR